MSDSHSNLIIIDKLKEAGSFSESIDISSGTNQYSGSLVLRRLLKEGGFLRTVYCDPGNITVIDSSDDPELEPFRESLIGLGSETPVAFRCNTQSVHPSEILSIRYCDYTWSGETVYDALLKVGAEEEDVDSLLEILELEKEVSLPLGTLEETELRRLLIACSLFAKARFIVYDSPFKNVSNPWKKVLAEILLNQVQTSKQVVIVTGMQSIPSIWKTSPFVQIESSEVKRVRKVTAGTAEKEMQGAVFNVRKLMSKDAIKQQDSKHFITRPMVIYKVQKNRNRPEILQSEAIVNPEFVDDFNINDGTLPGSSLKKF